MRSGAVLLLFGTLIWGQAQMEQSPSDAPRDTGATEHAGAMSENAMTIPTDAGVITINGVCGDSATKKVGAPSECKTVITRTQFETLLQLIQPNISQGQRRNFAAGYAETLIRAQQAHEMGLDRGPRFEALMKQSRDETLQFLLMQSLKDKAAQVPDKDILQFYNDNRETFVEIELQELYVPMVQAIPAASQQVEKRLQDSIIAMKKTADALRTRAVAGEDFAQLQAEAYKAADYGSTDALPKVEIQKYRRRDLRFADQVSVMDLKSGEVSRVFDEPNGHYIYKVGAKDVLPLEQVRDEIAKKLRGERLRKYLQEVQQYATATFDEKYFADTSTESHEEPTQ